MSIIDELFGTQKPGRKTGSKKETTKKVDPMEAFQEALAALPEELKDSEFVRQYVKHRTIARTKRLNAKAEQEATQVILAKAKDAKEKAELVGAFRSKDFIISVYETAKGRYYREITARPKLRIN